MNVICLNGTINAGKSHVGRELLRRLPDARLVEGEESGVSAEQPLTVRIAAALTRIETFILGLRHANLIVAYPLRDEDYQRIEAACRQRGARLLCATLAPPQAIALTNRGARELTDWERERIVAMYQEGYHERAFSDLIIDTSRVDMTATAQRIVDALRQA